MIPPQNDLKSMYYLEVTSLKLSASLISHSKDWEWKRKAHNLRPRSKHSWLQRTINWSQKSIHCFPKLVWGELPRLHRHSEHLPMLWLFAGSLCSISNGQSPEGREACLFSLPRSLCELQGNPREDAWGVAEKPSFPCATHWPTKEKMPARIHWTAPFSLPDLAYRGPDSASLFY